MLHARKTHASIPLAELIDTGMHLPPAAPAALSYHPRPPQPAHSEADEREPAGVYSMLQRPPQPAHGEADEREPAGVMSVLQSIRSSLLRLETSLFEPPCNTTGALAAECDAAPRPAARQDWLGRHHFGLRRQILSYTPASTPSPPPAWEGTPLPSGAWDGTPPASDGFVDSDPDPDLPLPSP